MHSLFGVNQQHLFRVCVLLPSVWAFRRQNNRIIHDLTFMASPGASNVNANTDFESAPKLRLGRVLHDIVRRILLLRQNSGPRHVLKKRRCRSRNHYAKSRSTGLVLPFSGTCYVTGW